LQALPAGSVAAGAAGGAGSLRIPGEDWFESSLPAETPSSSGVMEPAGLTQAFHANLAANPGAGPAANFVTNANLVANLETDLKAHPLLDAGLIAAAIAPERLSSAYRVVPEAVSIQASAAMATKAGQRWHDRGVPGIGLDDQLMDEIPLLFAQVPVERQPASMRVRLGIVLVDGLLMAGAVLAAAVVATLNLKELPSITEMGLGVAAVVFVAALIHVTVRRLFRRFSAARRERRAPGPAERR
jgi:hypothetical protein